jgi:NAD(P)-dependent dehydrogenase (short-subunit alcohol dehydrogenase family)
MASLANKTALVTGASRGIGHATAEALAKAVLSGSSGGVGEHPCS